MLTHYSSVIIHASDATSREKNIMAIKQTVAVIQPPTELKSHVITLHYLLSVDQETLDAEYKELGSLADTFQYTKAAAALDVNEDKNRYINIRPCKSVELLVLGDDE